MQKEAGKEVKRHLMVSRLETPLATKSCEVQGPGCERYFLVASSQYACRTCRESEALAAHMADAAAWRAADYALRGCEEGGDSCAFFLFVKRGTPDAVCEHCRNEYAAQPNIPYPGEQGAKRVFAWVAEALKRWGGVLERVATALVTRFGRADGHDFYTRLAFCKQCRGFGYDDCPRTGVTPCTGVVVTHYTLSRKRLGNVVTHGEPVELAGKVWPFERSAKEVLLELP